jgi:dienelactone hydrolase
MRGTTMALLLLWLMLCPSAAQNYSRENLRVPFADAGPRGLEAQLVRPADGRRYPLAVIGHGSPRDVQERPHMTPGRYYVQALEFARRGFAVLIVTRRGYGSSGGDYAEGGAACGRNEYLKSARESARDLRAAIEFMQTRNDISTQQMIAIGRSAGGLAAVALAAEPPSGLAAVINFSGGRGSRGDRNVCGAEAQVEAFGALGQTARTPMLWVYSENDLYFWPELAQRFHAAFQASGGRAKFVAAQPFGRDGHSLFSEAGAPIWIPIIDDFLREQNLGLRTPLPPLASDALPAPGHFRPDGPGRGAFRQYLRANDHKAFAVSQTGNYAWRSGAATEDEAQRAAQQACERNGATCSIYAVNGELESERSRPR